MVFPSAMAAMRVHTQLFHPKAGVLPRPFSSRFSMACADALVTSTVERYTSHRPAIFYATSAVERQFDQERTRGLIASELSPATARHSGRGAHNPFICSHQSAKPDRVTSGKLAYGPYRAPRRAFFASIPSISINAGFWAPAAEIQKIPRSNLKSRRSNRDRLAENNGSRSTSKTGQLIRLLMERRNSGN
jgi:hypothetical protein